MTNTAIFRITRNTITPSRHEKLATSHRPAFCSSLWALPLPLYLDQSDKDCVKSKNFKMGHALAFLRPLSATFLTASSCSSHRRKDSALTFTDSPIQRFLFALPLQEKLHQRQVLLLSYVFERMLALDCVGMASRQTSGFCLRDVQRKCGGSGQGEAVRDASRALAQPLAMIVAQPASCRPERFSLNKNQPKKTTARGSK